MAISAMPRMGLQPSSHGCAATFFALPSRSILPSSSVWYEEFSDREQDYSKSPRNEKLRVLQALLAVTAIALLALAFVYFRQTPPEAPLRRFAFTPESLQPTLHHRPQRPPNKRSSSSPAPHVV